MRTTRALVIAIFACSMALPLMAHAGEHFRTIYTFHGHANDQPVDGAGPLGSLTAVGNTLYGTTRFGGTAYSGTIYSIDPVTFVETPVYSFAGGVGDGAGPVGGLQLYGGTLYGATITGGTSNFGTVFSFDPAHGETVLHNFTGGSDGANPQAGLIFANGFLYGTTLVGGPTGCFDKLGCGTVFSINLFTGAETVIHAFQGGTDGMAPRAALTLVGDTLYGTTSSGGGVQCILTLGCGTIFKYDLKAQTYSQLYRFHGGKADGAAPIDAMTLNKGILYGTTQSGGGIGCGYTGCGTIFALDLSSCNGKSECKPTILYADFDSATGVHPNTTPALSVHRDDPSVHRDIYGTTIGGGARFRGTLYQYDLATGAVTPLFDFSGGDRGGVPDGALLQYDHSFYGTTYSGGKYKSGTVFKLTP